MTKQVRVTYRSHRKAAWVVMLALVGVLAAVVIPLASGGSGKTYTLSVTSSAPCASPASATVTVKNTTSPQTLGSIEIYFPPKTVATVLSPANAVLRRTRPARPSLRRRTSSAIDDFNVASGARSRSRVKFKPGVSFNTAITAVAKQSNKFNDSSGSANTFDISGGFPTLKIVTCVTVSGRVYQDRNLDNVYSQGQGAFTQADLAKSWTVKLYGKNVGDPNQSYAVVDTKTSSASDGTYAFTQVPTRKRLQGLRHRDDCAGFELDVEHADPDREPGVRSDRNACEHDAPFHAGQPPAEPRRERAGAGLPGGSRRRPRGAEYAEYGRREQLPRRSELELDEGERLLRPGHVDGRCRAEKLPVLTDQPVWGGPSADAAPPGRSTSSRR